MPTFHCPVCNFKSFTEKEERDHAKTHQKPTSQPTEPATKKPDEPKKPFIMPDFIKRFLHRNVLITLIDGSTISGELTGFNNYEVMIDEKIMILKHAMMKMQEVETN